MNFRGSIPTKITITSSRGRWWLVQVAGLGEILISGYWDMVSARRAAIALYGEERIDRIEILEVTEEP